MTIDQIIKVDIAISEAMAIDGGYDTILIIGPLPKTPGGHMTPDVAGYTGTQDLKSAGFSTDDPVYIAASSLVGRLMEDSIHTSAPSKVGKVENNHTAKLTPNLKVTTDDGREVPYPEISGTIILMPCGAGGTVGFAFPVKSDDGCLALFNEGGSGTDLKWDLSNAALLPGLYQSPGEQVKKAGSEEAAIMFAPSSTITVTKDKIEIKKDDTKITVTSDSIKMEKGSTTVTASTSSVDVVSPSLSIKGNTKVNGNISVTGNVTISGTLTLGGIVMNTHTHAGVHGQTGGPV